jgi:hypothetical protein
LLTALQHCAQEITKESEITKLRGGQTDNDRKISTNPANEL